MNCMRSCHRDQTILGRDKIILSFFVSTQQEFVEMNVCVLLRFESEGVTTRKLAYRDFTNRNWAQIEIMAMR